MAEAGVGVGIVGLGHIGKYHVAALGRFPGIKLVAVCDRRREFAALAPAGVDFRADYQEVLDDARVDTVVVATPNDTHYLIARRALEAGKNLVLEKPAAGSMAEVEQLEASARRAGLSVYYAFHAAEAPDVAWFVDYYRRRAGELGPPTAFVCRFHDPYFEAGSLVPGARGLQNCWLDSGINAISVIQRVFGLGGMSVDDVSLALNPGVSPRFIQCGAHFRFSPGRGDCSGVGVIETNWASGRDHKSTLLHFGSSCNCVLLDHSRQAVFRRGPDGQDAELADLSGGRDRLFNHYIGVFRDFLERRRAGTMNGPEALAAHRLLFEVEDKINLSLSG